MIRPFSAALAAILAMGLALSGCASTQSNQRQSKEQRIVDQARLTAKNMLGDEHMPDLRLHMKTAKAVLIVPSAFKAGFLFGGEGGDGVLLTRTKQGGWSDPAFYTIGSGSFGLQAGVQQSQTMLLIMNEKALNALLKTPVNFGGSLSIAVGPAGGGITGATTAGLGADVLSFSKARGLYGGLTLTGAYAQPRQDLHKAFYGKELLPRDIVARRSASNPALESLRAALATVPLPPVAVVRPAATRPAADGDRRVAASKTGLPWRKKPAPKK